MLRLVCTRFSANTILKLYVDTMFSRNKSEASRLNCCGKIVVIIIIYATTFFFKKLIIQTYDLNQKILSMIYFHFYCFANHWKLKLVWMIFFSFFCWLLKIGYERVQATWEEIVIITFTGHLLDCWYSDTSFYSPISEHIWSGKKIRVKEFYF